MGKEATFKDYIEAIITLLCDSYDYTVAKAREEVEDFSEFLSICFSDGWSVLSCVEMIAAEA